MLFIPFSRPLAPGSEILLFDLIPMPLLLLLLSKPVLLSPEVEEISVLRVCCFKENDGAGGRLCSASELGDCNLLRCCALGSIESDEASSDDNDNDERDITADEDCWCSEMDEKPEYDGSTVATLLVLG